jgi:hypothetical protein
MDMRNNLSGGNFGRRRSALMGVAPDASASGSRPSYTVEAEGISNRISALRLAGYMFGAVLTLLCIEAMLSDTSLITPIDTTFLNIMRVIGLIIGVPLALLVIAKPHQPMGIMKKVMILLCLPLLTGFTGGEVAWRISDWIEFGFSSAEFEPATYPIKYASHGRRGRRDSVEIDPFAVKEGTDIAVPSWQFDSIWPHQSDYCITVMQRRSASGAIEIRNDGVFTLREPAPAVLTRCNGESAPGSEGSPWDKKPPRL